MFKETEEHILNSENNEEYIEKLSKNFSTAISLTINKNLIELDEYNELEENALNNIRDLYLKIFDEQEKKYFHKSEWWIEQFRKITKILVKKYGLLTISQEDKNKNLVLSYNNELYEFDLGKKLILIGRMTGCDILINRTLQVSRLHMIIVILSEYNKIIIIDPGSLNGIITKSRSKEKLIQHSVGKSRKILEFDLDESFDLKIGDSNICVSPKECIICYNKPRNCLFECGHYICCNNCIEKINKCPLCRQNININKYEVTAFHTKIL